MAWHLPFDLCEALRRHAELVGLKSNFTILDTDDQNRLIKQLILPITSMKTLACKTDGRDHRPLKIVLTPKRFKC